MTIIEQDYKDEFFYSPDEINNINNQNLQILNLNSKIILLLYNFCIIFSFILFFTIIYILLLLLLIIIIIINNNCYN